MKVLNRKNGNRAIQAGFTIIELVVVILLLGILTATALPRFLDISDEAHGAVVEAHLASLSTATALYRAAWYANAQTSAAIDYDALGPGAALFPSGVGYPAGVAAGVDPEFPESEADCVAIFTNLMQSGGTSLQASAAGNTTDVALALQGNILTTGTPSTYSGQEFAAVFVNITPATPSSGDSCEYYYTGQFSQTGDLPRVIVYNPEDGSMSINQTAVLADTN